MSRMGKLDVSGLGKLRRTMKKALNEARQKEFIEDCAGGLAEELLKRVVLRTPEGDYSGDPYVCSVSDTGRAHSGLKEAGRQGGALRDAWHCGIKEWQGGKFVVEVINDAENKNGEPYASYVEYGHRVREGMKGKSDNADKCSGSFVPGHFMLEISREEVEELAPKMLEALLKGRLMEVFGI